MPFTDPMADGPAIQAAGLRALKAGMTLTKTLQVVRDFRKGEATTPIDVNDLVKLAQATPEPRCDEAALTIFGLTLAGWDMVASAALAVYAALAARFAR